MYETSINENQNRRASNRATNGTASQRSGAMVEEIRLGRRQMELLAPAGKREILEAVIEAGADAVYVSGKRFQMRAHRGDFHFDSAGLRDATRYVHEKGKRIYVTLNTILADHELDDVRSFLEELEETGVDAIIVCDLAVLSLARELGVSFEIHISTMMNVHDLDQVRLLKELGVQRIVTSRDISITEAGALGEKSGIPIEYFVHGDMCVAQSGQCTMSGITMGKSANRGECMKPCRWNYELISLRNGSVSKPLREGHLMAVRDLSLIRQLPELVAAGICSLKIEGRMRDAAYLSGVVGLYREVLDEFYRWPGSFYVRSKSMETLFRSRVRNLSALSTSGASSNKTFFDVSGKREPLILSNGCTEPCADPSAAKAIFFGAISGDEDRATPELSVSVGSLAGAEAALEGGADRVYLASETSQFSPEQWTPDTFAEALSLVVEKGAMAGIGTPRVSTKRVLLEWQCLLRQCQGNPVHYVLVHHLGALKRVREELPQAKILVDYGFNTLTTRAA
ncbi:MAG: U32 family peptidase, partial [Candidatus Hydrogenedentes bacterium]|nr:U32 family peptidase [Candidatus Hydrogenedentota bacterium]